MSFTHGRVSHPPTRHQAESAFRWKRGKLRTALERMHHLIMCRLPRREIISQNPDDCTAFSKTATLPNVLCGSSPVQRYIFHYCLLYHYIKFAPVVRLPFIPSSSFSPSISRALSSLGDRRSHSRHRIRCVMAERFTIPASSSMPGTVG
jgi:hypothetical protein